MNQTIRFLATAATKDPHHHDKKKFELDLPPNYTMAHLGWYDPFYSEDDYHKECQILDDFAIVMQTILGVASFASLLLKRRWEMPKRSYRIFMLDISK